MEDAMRVSDNLSPALDWNIFYRRIYLNNILPTYMQHLRFKFTEIVKWAS